MLALIFTFAFKVHASAPAEALNRFVGPFQLVSQVRLPVDQANQESRWQFVGYLEGRKFRACVTCVWMPMSDNKYAHRVVRFCQPVDFAYL